MENCNVVIVGAGIAGCGLAYNLRKICPECKVFLLDKNCIGGNAGYGYRLTTARIVEEYGLSFAKEFEGIAMGEQLSYAKAKQPYYFISYQGSCRALLEKSNATFIRAEARNVSGNVLDTNEGRFRFDYLVDCSGSSFFLRRLFNKQVPFRYWIGLTRVFEGKMRGFDENYAHYLFNEEGSLEEIYTLKNKVIQGLWQYTTSPEFEQFKIPAKSLVGTNAVKSRLIREDWCIIPNTPVFPMVEGPFAFLGDSFGNAYASSAVGTEPALDSSKLLAKAIRQKKLGYYEKEWKRLYLASYSRYLASRIDRYNQSPVAQFLKQGYPKNTEVMQLLKDNPVLMHDIMLNKHEGDFGILLDAFPWYERIFLLYHYSALRIHFALMPWMKS